MASLNKVMLIGSLGRDPEVRHMPNGDAVANFSIATSESWKDKNGQKQERTEWHNIVIYRKLAEIAGEYLKKGRPVYIEGRLQTRKWEKDGVTRYTTEIIADEMQMLASKDGGGSNQESSDDQNTGSNNSRSTTSSNRQAPAQAPANSTSNFDDFEDDIPF